MKVAELREKLVTMSKEELIVVASEFYKALPKAKKEDASLLDRAFSPAMTKEKKAQLPKNAEEFSLAEMQPAIELFVEHAADQYYRYPNKVVSKKERGGWRFMVKKWFKELTKLNRSDANAQQQADLLCMLYTLLSKAEGYEYFSTSEPFNSIGIDQDIFFKQLAFFIIEAEGKSGFADKVPTLIAKNSYISYSRSKLVDAVIEILTPNYYRQIVEGCETEIFKLQAQVGLRDKNSYGFKSAKEHFGTLAAHLLMHLGEASEALEIFQKHSSYSDSEEVVVYCSLQFLKTHNQLDLAKKLLDESHQKGLKLRNDTQKLERYINQHGKFPLHF